MYFKAVILGGEFHEKCDIGQYSDAPQAESDGDCLTCPAGSACPILGTTLNDMETCEEGYYCPSGSSSRRANICEEGYYCPENSSEPTLCDAGSACSVKGRVSTFNFVNVGVTSVLGTDRHPYDRTLVAKLHLFRWLLLSFWYSLSR